MQTHKKIFLALFAFAMLMPLARQLPGAVSFVERDALKEDLNSAINDAVGDYKRRSSLVSMTTKGEKTKEAMEKKIASLETEKRRQRIRILALRRVSEQVKRKYDLSFTGSTALQTVIRREEAVLTRLTKEHFRVLAEGKLQNAGKAILDAMRGSPDKDSLRARIALQIQYLKDLNAGYRALSEEESLIAKRDDTITEYVAAVQEYKKAERLVAVSEQELEEIKAIMKEVHEEVLRLQGELARIDETLRVRAQRELIKKGLLDRDDIAKHAAADMTPSFSWPVYGPVSAGFMNASYKKHFGVNHFGTDIVVGQGTPVAAAADGIVFLARDGGKTGYSYLLIGHRGGYATLYGHLSEFLVAPGQTVSKGDVVALSGGQPGTHGAGPMTTAAHLHFEVIKDGTNVNPQSVLP